MHTSRSIHPPTSKFNKMVNEADLQAPLMECDKFKAPNYTQIAKLKNVHRTTLSRRHCKKTVSREEANSRHCQLLTNTQETTLIEDINRLAKLGLYITPNMLTALV
jgi:hypothetical protein